MSKRSGNEKTVKLSRKNLRQSDTTALDRLRKAMKGKIDTSELSESLPVKPILRDAQGILPQRKSIIREAIDQRRKELRLTPYRLWKMAIPFHASLSQAAVHEFLKGQRQLELPSAEALLAAIDLQLVVSTKAKPGKTSQ